MQLIYLIALLACSLLFESTSAQAANSDLVDCRADWRSVASKWRGNEADAQKLFIERCMKAKGYEPKRSCSLGTNDVMLPDCYTKLDTSSPAMRRLLREEECLLEDLRAGQKGMGYVEREICIRRARES